MIVILLAASLVSPPANEVAYDHLMAGQHDEAITVINRQLETDDPARLINLGVAYARKGDSARARAMFRAAHNADERVDLETAEGEWVYSRVLARRAIAMLDSGEFNRTGLLARN